MKHFTYEDLFLGEDSPGIVYEQKSILQLGIAAWGQRKLLINEILFMTIFWDPNKIPNPRIIYVGAAPGDHISILSTFFPTAKFYLYDPNPFIIPETDYIKIYKELFKDETAEEWSKNNNGDIFFISDIRSEGFRSDMTDDEKKDLEVKIWKEMELQSSWVKKINPVYANLKFRLPWFYPKWMDEKNRKVSYLKGLVFLQPWIGATSSESRLVPMRNNLGEYYDVEWDFIKYESQMHYHNRVSRKETKYYNPFSEKEKLYPQDVKDENELLNDYDSIFEYKVLMSYLKKVGNVTEKNIIALSKLITDLLNEARKGSGRKKTLDSLRNICGSTFV